MLVEDTYYSTEPALDRSTIRTRLDAYVADRGWQVGRIEQEEEGVLPVAMGGDFDAFWPQGDPVARIGMSGGFFHPTTGYSFPDAVRTALSIARLPDFADLASRLRSQSRRLWKQRAFYRLLNRMLFRGAAPRERYLILEHFYRLEPALIERFYAGRSTWADCLRIVSGKPPIPISRGLKAMRP
jgi:lycopene beta-cyclase